MEWTTLQKSTKLITKQDTVVLILNFKKLLVISHDQATAFYTPPLCPPEHFL